MRNRVAFSCGVETPDRYLQRQAGQDIGKHVAAAFVITPDGETVAGFYALSAHTRSRIRAISTKKTAESSS